MSVPAASQSYLRIQSAYVDANEKLKALAEATERQPTLDEYQAARRKPKASKFRWDHATTGATYMLRHAQRAWAQGEKKKAVAMRCAASPLIGASAVAHILLMVPSILVFSPGPYCFLYDKSSHSMRSEWRAREDIMMHALKSMHGQLKHVGKSVVVDDVQMIPKFVPEFKAFCEESLRAIDKVSEEKVPERLRSSADLAHGFKSLRKDVARLQVLIERKVNSFSRPRGVFWT